MDLIEKILLPPHIIAGFLSIVVFWLPVFTRKGGTNHVRIGKLYIFFMWIVVITALLMSIENLYYGFYAAGSFLGFLALITANPLWRGIAILKHKKMVTSRYRRVNLALEILIFLSGAAMLITGIILKAESMAVLMIIFGVLGISNAGRIWKDIRQPVQKADWMMEHIKGMITSGIAAYTAFFAFGGRAFLGDIFTGYWMVIPWVAPTVIGLISIRLLERKYKEKREEATELTPSPGLSIAE